MGGKQDGISRRLSKPRTNNNSSSNLLKFSEQPLETSSPLTSSDMDYFGDTTVVTSQGERRSRRKSRSGLRAYLYGSPTESSQMVSSDDEDGKSSSSLSGAARGAKKRLSRTSSSLMQLSSARASTTQFSNSSRQLLRTDTEESAIIAEQVKERAYRDSLAARNHVSSPVDEDKHVDSVLAPVRRKSLYTPGIATRNTSDILRKPPPPKASLSDLSQADRDYYYNPAHPDTSPLARLAALSVPEDGRGTPSNLNIPHLGGLQLGTLRVTNGTATPVPQTSTSVLHRLSPTPSSVGAEEYQTASEGSADEGLMTPRSPFKVSLGAAKSPLTVVAHIEGTTLEDSADRESLLQQGAGTSEPRSPCCASALADTYMTELSGGPYFRAQPPRNPVLADEVFSDEAIVIPEWQETDNEMWRDWINEVGEVARGSREDALDRLNGHSDPVPQSQRLSVPLSSSSQNSMSTDTAPRADSGYNSNDSLDVSQKLNLDYENSRFEHILQEQKSSISRDVSGPRTMPAPPNNDSIALGPLPKVTPSFTVIPRYAMEEPGPSETNTADATDTRKAMRLSNRSSSHNLVRKLRKARPKSQPPQVRSVDSVETHQLSEIQLPRVPSQMAAKHAERLSRFPLLEHTFPSSEHVTAGKSPSPTDFKHIPIRFPSPANALESPCTGLSIDDVVRDQRKDQMSRQDQMALNTGTTGDGRSASSPVKPPTWSAFGLNKTPKEQRKLVKKAKEEERRLLKDEQDLAKRLERDRKNLEKQVKKDDARERSSRSHTSSRTRGKSSERRTSQHEMVATIADFGTVSESLGGSPYDIATAIHPNASRDASGCHPHQMSSAIQRPKSLLGSDENTRARSRSRSQNFDRNTSSANEPSASQDRPSLRRIRPRPKTMFLDAPPMPALSAVDIRAHNLEWARTQKRTRSYSAGREASTNGFLPKSEVFDDRGGIPGKAIRPRSMILNAPPVPDLPPLPHVQQRHPNIDKSTPQGMIVDGATSDDDSSNDANTVGPLRRQPDLLVLQKTKSSKLAIPDLWSSGSLEKKNPRNEVTNLPSNVHALGHEITPQSDQSCMWEVQRQAWSQHRKSAGEALLSQIRVNETVIDPVILNGSATRSEARMIECRLDPASAVDPTASPAAPPEEQTYLPTPSERRTQLFPQQQSRPHRIPRKSVGSGTSTPSPSTTPIPTHNPLATRLIGRYEGGFQYGYEPGCGLGGSAGTRGAKTEASRKSVEVSQGFGVDLSDVPVFVAAAGQR